MREWLKRCLRKKWLLLTLPPLGSAACGGKKPWAAKRKCSASASRSRLLGKLAGAFPSGQAQAQAVLAEGARAFRQPPLHRALSGLGSPNAWKAGDVALCSMGHVPEEQLNSPRLSKSPGQRQQSHNSLYPLPGLKEEQRAVSVLSLSLFPKHLPSTWGEGWCPYEPGGL